MPDVVPSSLEGGINRVMEGLGSKKRVTLTFFPVIVSRFILTSCTPSHFRGVSEIEFLSGLNSLTEKVWKGSLSISNGIVLPLGILSEGITFQVIDFDSGS